ncbi:hypothetical protein BDW62DRAFT_159976 [Aspergillus aurantiobrunneus]
MFRMDAKGEGGEGRRKVGDNEGGSPKRKAVATPPIASNLEGSRPITSSGCSISGLACLISCQTSTACSEPWNSELDSVYFHPPQQVVLSLYQGLQGSPSQLFTFAQAVLPAAESLSASKYRSFLTLRRTNRQASTPLPGSPHLSPPGLFASRRSHLLRLA